MDDSYEQLIKEALALPIEGWDFASMGGRLQHAALPWDYGQIVRSLLPVDTLLDQGTGGGELLSSLAPLPPLTVATESWRVNVPIAHDRLRRLSANVVHTEAVPNNSEQAHELLSSLPFRSGAFDLVINRHESFVASEVARVLRHGGHFVTQQVEPSGDEFFAELFAIGSVKTRVWDSDAALLQVSAAGFDILDLRRGDQTLTIRDVGALVWYLRAVPWTVPGFSPELFEDRLRQLHLAMVSWPLVVPQPRFLIVCRRR